MKNETPDPLERHERVRYEGLLIAEARGAIDQSGQIELRGYRQAIAAEAEIEIERRYAARDRKQ